jgi:hypothetical protein
MNSPSSITPKIIQRMRGASTGKMVADQLVENQTARLKAMSPGRISIHFKSLF